MTRNEGLTHAHAFVIDRANIEAIYPLSAAQQALLFEHLAHKASDAGRIQVVFSFHGAVTPEQVREAWDRVVARQPVLRATIHWEGLKKPQCVIRRKVDWELNTVSEGLERHRVEERKRPLVLSEAPSWRLQLLQISDSEHQLVWSCHHLLVDGWSSMVALQQWLRTLNDILQGRSGETASLSSVLQAQVRWLKGRDRDALAAFWQERVRRIAIGPGASLKRKRKAQTGESDPFAVRKLALDSASVAEIPQRLRSLHCPGNAVVLGAWGLALQRCLGMEVVTFGTVASGRSGNVEGLEALVGMFAGVVPVTVSRESGRSVQDWLVAIRDELAQIQTHAGGTLAEIEEWTGEGGVVRAVESLAVFQDLPNLEDGRTDQPIRPGHYQSEVTSRFPLLVAVLPGEDWQFCAQYDRREFEADTVDHLLELFRDSFCALCQRPDASVESVFEALEWRGPELREASTPVERSAGRAGSESVAESGLEWRLSHIFRELFPGVTLGPHDDFFALGGDSLLAGRLSRRVEQELGIVLPLSLIVECPSVATLAARLGEGQDARRRCMVLLRDEGSKKPPLFCLHAGGMEVMYFQPLSRALRTGRSVFGLQPPLVTPETFPGSVRELAEIYLQEIRAVQSRGPYFLLGYCYGVRPIVELARILGNELNESVCLVILDTGPPLKPVGLGSELEPSLWGCALGFVRSVVTLDFRSWSRRIRTFLALMQHKFRRGWGYRFGSTTDRLRLEIVDTMLKLPGDGIEQAVKADCLLIRSQETEANRSKDFHVEWERYVDRFRTVTLDSRHRDLLSARRVGDLAAQIDSYLDECVGEGRNTPA